jgi:hypothetical protein
MSKYIHALIALFPNQAVDVAHASHQTSSIIFSACYSSITLSSWLSTYLLNFAVDIMKDTSSKRLFLDPYLRKLLHLAADSTSFRRWSLRSKIQVALGRVELYYEPVDAWLISFYTLYGVINWLVNLIWRRFRRVLNLWSLRDQGSFINMCIVHVRRFRCTEPIKKQN